MVSEPNSTASTGETLTKGYLMLGEKIGEISGKITMQRVLANLGGYPKMATWTGHGVGVRNKDGTATYRGALYFQTMPPKWSRLNKVAVLFEYAVDAGGNTHSEYWEWK